MDKERPQDTNQRRKETAVDSQVSWGLRRRQACVFSLFSSCPLYYSIRFQEQRQQRLCLGPRDQTRDWARVKRDLLSRSLSCCILQQLLRFELIELASLELIGRQLSRPLTPCSIVALNCFMRSRWSLTAWRRFCLVSSTACLASIQRRDHWYTCSDASNCGSPCRRLTTPSYTFWAA